MSFGSVSLGPPSPEQLKRWERIGERGCLACWMNVARWILPAHIHHQTVGGRHGALRLGHDFTIGLCGWHHMGRTDYGFSREEMELEWGPSFALTPQDFRREFGVDAELLAAQNERIEWTKPPQRERVRRNGSPTARPSKSFRPATEAKPLRDERSTLEVSRTTQKKRREGLPEKEGVQQATPHSLPPSRRRGSKRGTHCQRPDKVLPRGNRIV